MGLIAASAGGELCELDRYELEFFKMPVAVSLRQPRCRAAWVLKAYPLVAQGAMRASAAGNVRS